MVPLSRGPPPSLALSSIPFPKPLEASDIFTLSVFYFIAQGEREWNVNI